MDFKKTANTLIDLTLRAKRAYDNLYREPVKILTLEYIGELVEEFKWIDPMKLEYALVSYDYPDLQNEVKLIKFPLDRNHKYTLGKIKLELDYDYMMSQAYGKDGYMVRFDEYERVYNDESRIEHFIDNQVIPALASIRIDKTGSFDFLMIQMEEPAKKLYQTVEELKDMGYDVPESVKDRVYDFMRIFVKATDEIREKTDKVAELTKSAEIDSYNQTVDMELKYLKQFVLKEKDTEKDLHL